MSFPSRVDTVYANEISCTPVDSADFNIVNTKGGEILLNGVAPGGAGGSLPIIGTGNISVTGNITANGDGIDNGKIEGQRIKSVDNIIISQGSLEVITGGVDIKQNGNMTLEGSGNINQLGSGKITSGTGGIESKGELKTNAANDIHSGKDLVFDGQDIYKSYPSIVPAIPNKTYKDYKGLVGKNDNNIFTGSNQFNSNTTEFSAKVSVGTRDALSELFTQNLALNTSGNIECKTINNGTIIQCGNINCGNAGLNEVRAREFKTRTNENNSPEGWTISQEIPSNPAQNLDRALQFKGGEANAFITILDNAHSGFVPNIVLDPRTSVLGGLIAATTHQVGQGGEAFKLEQPNSGADADNLLIQAGLNQGIVKFQDYTGATNLMTIEKEAGTNDGLLRVPSIVFGEGNRNKIYNLQDGATNLNLNIQHASASSEIVFQDHQLEEIIKVRKTEVVFGNSIPLNFGFYSFRPQQYYKDITAFSFNHSAIGSTNLLFNTGNPGVQEWTNVNTGATNEAIDLINNPGAYKITIRQTSAGALGEINGIFIMSDIVLSRPNDGAPTVELAQPTAYSFTSYDGVSPIITMVPGFLTWAVHCTFPQVSGNETSNIRITMTQMPFFA